MLAVLAFTAACSPSAGKPVPEEPPTTSSATPSTSVKPSSPRPREIKVDGLRPCDLLTTEQLPGLKIDRPGRSVTSDFYQTTACSWTVTGASNRLTPVTREGIEEWTGGKRTGRPTEIEPILDFPAITVTLPSDPAACDVMVDTADGQYLVATFSVLPGFEDRFPEPCDGARQLAEAAMQNLSK
ncbi:DUF3558 domain-containing protein [Saccharothrix longispora]|uniref:DUF3558 domain-containing protein n=1 Tax=Saccharothrix longispora TaxID=33920 RepID=UPI0028FDA5C6|nr:DUF3558 domain-containing protein [Saccharothrix longispora]MBY8850774.1 DUF3558 domain-containing protein [Saccharothrix sp. MB29]MDU0289071.1 DUF3558 domain-containing protein [Saccharothrix longispora]